MTNSSSLSGAKIILVRHGQSTANAGGVTNDHMAIPLTELGWTQARTFAADFSQVPTRFIVSTFLRARQTAYPLLQRFPHTPVEDWPIHEFTYLEPARHNGTTDAQRMPHVLEYWERCDPSYIDGPSAESFSNFLDRVRHAIQRLSVAPLGACIVVFTHGLWMQAFRLCLLFPHSTDAELMLNFRTFHFSNLLHNLDSLEFDASNGQMRLLGQPYLSNFTLQRTGLTQIDRG